MLIGAGCQRCFGGQLRLILVAAAMVLTLTALCFGTMRTSAQSGTATATIPADTPVRVVLINHGVIAHNFSITDHKNSGLQNLNISVDTDPGQTSEATINAPEGTYYCFCNVPGHEQAGMYGYLTVKKGATISTAGATVTPRAG